MARRYAGPLLLAALLLTACTTPGATPPEPTEVPTTALTGPVDLTLSVYAAPAELPAWQRIINSWNAQHPLAHLSLSVTADRDQQRARITSGDPLPDVFLVSRRELGWLLENQANLPVGELLDERGVRFGDDFQRSAINAFGAGDDLQCMPWGVSPMVMYYNTDLVDFDQMATAGLEVPEDHTDWTFAQFQAAAEWAVANHAGARGVQIDESLRGLAPFVYAAGGSYFDDPVQPTAMTLSDGDTLAALEEVLPVLTDPSLVLTPAQRAEAPALAWFKRGVLAMLPGFRSLTPQLRRAPDLDFDVMPMPSVGGRATIGDISGLCMAATTANPGLAADVVQFFTQPTNVAQVASAGYLVPANVQVAESENFLQPDQDPASAAVFNEAVRDIVNPPVLDDPALLEATIASPLRRLFAGPLADLEAIAAEIDAAAAPLLATMLPSATP